MTTSEADPTISKMALAAQVLGSYISKISCTKNQLKHLNTSASVDYMHRTIQSFTKKQQTQGREDRSIYYKSKVSTIHKNLLKYTKKEITVGDLIKMPKNKKSRYRNFSTDMIIDENYNRIKYREVMLERKYNVPLAIKVSILRQTQGIRDNKQKIEDKKYYSGLKKQPLIKNMKKVLQEYKNRELAYGKPTNKEQMNKSTLQKSMNVLPVDEKYANFNEQHSNQWINYQGKQKNKSEYQKQKQFQLKNNIIDTKLNFITVPQSQKSLHKKNRHKYFQKSVHSPFKQNRQNTHQIKARSRTIKMQSHYEPVMHRQF